MQKNAQRVFCLFITSSIEMLLACQQMYNKVWNSYQPIGVKLMHQKNGVDRPQKALVTRQYTGHTMGI